MEVLLVKNPDAQQTSKKFPDIESSTDPNMMIDTHRNPSRPTIIGRVLSLVGGILEILLAFRIVFLLLRSSPANVIANFVYTVSQPLIMPFDGLLGYSIPNSILESSLYTLIAMGIYGLTLWVLLRVVTITQVKR